MKIGFFFLLLTTPLPLFADKIVEKEVETPSLEIFYDFEVLRLLPRKWEFENIEDKLFRSNDGKTLYFGPSSDNAYFIIQPEDNIQRLEAPSTGKAYVNKTGDFALWYNSLDQGIFFKRRDPLHLESPLRGRFGVSYDLAYSYIYSHRKTNIFEGMPSSAPIITLDALFVYKIVRLKEQLWIFGFFYLGHEETRQHLVLRFQHINKKWLEMDRFNLPNHLTLMDVNPYEQKALFLNEAEIAPQAFEIDLKSQRIHGLGLVEQFAIYLHPHFRKKPFQKVDEDSKRDNDRKNK